MQVGVPVEQLSVPVWHGFVGVHASPAVHPMQVPVWHTMFVPHVVPLATFPDAVQTGAPVEQAVAPVLHGMPLTAQLAPTVQAPHVPEALHTMFVPQLVPAARFRVVSEQVMAGEQDCVPA